MLRTRPLMPSDQALLWDLLHVSLWDPPPAPLRPRQVLDEPRVSIYARGWGRPGDVGVVGELPGEASPVGGCWVRLLPNRQGLAWVDEHTPQLGIAVFPGFQRRGIGRTLMLAALESARTAGYRCVSLTVHPDNPAVALYGQCGFEKAGIRNRYHLMIAAL